MVKITVLCCAIWLGCTAAPAAMPIHEPLLQRSTPHFHFIYTASTAPLVPHVAQACEDARRALAPFFRHDISRPVIVMLADDMDLHNGWATVVPGPRMRLYAAAAPPLSTIYEPGDELRRTVFHEYAHLVTMDALYGVRAGVSRIFGRVLPAGDPLSLAMAYLTLPPGVMAPAWYLEGLAIFAETQFVGPGRGRNSMADMILRMAVHDGRQAHPAAWSLELPEWPGADTAYLYGMQVMRYIHEHAAADQDDAAILGRLADRVNRSWPYLFDHLPLGLTGRTFDNLAHAAAGHERQRQHARLARLRQIPFTAWRPLTPPRLQVESPVFSADGQGVYMIVRGEAERGMLAYYDLSTGALRRYPRVRIMTGAGVRLAPAPDRRHLYYTQPEFSGRDRLWNRLYRFDTVSGKTLCLTGGRRYRYPAVSPDGSRLAAVRVAAGCHSLLEINLGADGRPVSEKVLLAADYGRFFLDPVYAADGRGLFHVDSGESGSRIVRLESGASEAAVMLEWPCTIMTLSLSADGRHLLFAADYNGVYNLYRMPADGSSPPYPLTHVPGGMFAAAESPDGARCLAVGYDSYGFRLASFDLGDELPDRLPEIEPDWPAAGADHPRHPPPVLSAPEPYRAWRAIRLDYWSPWWHWSADGDQFGARLALSDPAEYHALDLSGGYDLDADTWLGRADYIWSGLYPLLRLGGARATQSYPGLVHDSHDRCADYFETESRLGLALELPLVRRNWRADAVLGYAWTHRSGLEHKNAGRDRPAEPPLFEGDEAAAFAGLRWLTGTAFKSSFSVEDGRLVRLTGEYAGLGGDLDRTRLLACWSEYLALPWGDNHVLKLDVLQGVSTGDRFAQGSYGLGGYDYYQDDQYAIARNAALRGYPRNYRVGSEITRLAAAYRFPLLRCYRGVSSTMPVYAHQLFGELFYETGRTWNDTASGADGWISSAGLELNYGLTLLRALAAAPGVGLAYAFDRTARCDDEDAARWQVYMTVKGVVNF